MNLVDYIEQEDIDFQGVLEDIVVVVVVVVVVAVESLLLVVVADSGDQKILVADWVVQNSLVVADYIVDFHLPDNLHLAEDMTLLESPTKRKEKLRCILIFYQSQIPKLYD
jgi:hypothetical protein